MSADLDFAMFIDDMLRAYQTSGMFRSMLNAELPGAPQALVAICPPHHGHDQTGTCYVHHGCRCERCRAGSSRRQKQARVRRAVAGWRQQAGAAA